MSHPVNEKWCSKIINQADTPTHLVSQIFILMEMSEGVEREKECEAVGRTDMLARLLGFVTPERLVRNMSFPSDAGRISSP